MAGKKKIYLVGEKIGTCSYLRDSDVVSEDRTCVFLCTCGNEFTCTIKRLKSGRTKSCGCLRRKMVSDKNFKHGLRSLVEYGLWLNMKQRCTNPKFKYYADWGGRGITICDEWKDSFDTFYKDMGSQPGKRMGIDGVDNEKGYSRDNCRWASHKVQNNNKRNNVFVEFGGIKKSLTLWSEELGLHYEKARKMVHEKMYSIEHIFTITKKVA